MKFPNQQVLELFAKLVKNSQYDYPAEAYFTIYTIIQLINDRPDRTKREHISARLICEELVSVQREQFGPFAYHVLEHWGLRTTEDVGKVVFELVRFRLLVQGEDDSLSGFQGLCDLKAELEDHTADEPPYPDVPSLV